MLKSLLAVSAAVVFVAGASIADDKKTKVVNVNKCPVTGEDSAKAGGGSSNMTVKGVAYKVNFCCAGCKGKFDGMSKTDKEKKIADATKSGDKKKKG